MEIDVRHYSGYKEIIIEEGRTTITTGLLDKEEAARIAYELEQVEIELVPEYYEQIEREREEVVEVLKMARESIIGWVDDSRGMDASSFEEIKTIDRVIERLENSDR